MRKGTTGIQIGEYCEWNGGEGTRTIQWETTNLFSPLKLFKARTSFSCLGLSSGTMAVVVRMYQITVRLMDCVISPQLPFGPRLIGLIRVFYPCPPAARRSLKTLMDQVLSPRVCLSKSFTTSDYKGFISLTFLQ